MPGGDGARELLRRFVREFRPEQVKHYLAREVIARLRNASAIDLSQFAGSVRPDARERDDEDGEYGDLLAELRTGARPALARPYEVSSSGRWPRTTQPAPAARAAMRATARAPATPLAGAALEFEIDDGAGRARRC